MRSRAMTPHGKTTQHRNADFRKARTGLSFRAGALLAEERERRAAVRNIVLHADPAQKPRIKALVKMGDPTPEEAARLVAEFLARRSVTACPAAACAPINNDTGF